MILKRLQEIVTDSESQELDRVAASRVLGMFGTAEMRNILLDLCRKDDVPTAVLIELGRALARTILLLDEVERITVADFQELNPVAAASYEETIHKLGSQSQSAITIERFKMSL